MTRQGVIAMNTKSGLPLATAALGSFSALRELDRKLDIDQFFTGMLLGWNRSCAQLTGIKAAAVINPASRVLEAWMENMQKTLRVMMICEQHGEDNWNLTLATYRIRSGTNPNSV